jgi:hypothetical protein
MPNRHVGIVDDGAPADPPQRADRRDHSVGGRAVRAVVNDVLAASPEFQRFGHNSSRTKPDGLVDYLFAVGDEPHQPDEVFARLRWGGQFVYLSRNRRAVEALPTRFVQRGFAIVRGASSMRLPFLGMRLPMLARCVHYFIARKVFLIRPREITDRFTFHVQLVPDPARVGNYVVSKEIPALDRVMARLRARFTDLPLSVLEKRARKFTEKIFPLFLTREAAMLQILERDLPSPYRERVPRVLKLQHDGRGYVRRLWMNWLRQGRPRGAGPLAQVEFARDGADLLRVVHDTAGVMHLDLRLDNVVITERGVGFVDFGSAVRVGENIHGNPMLSTIFDELMRTSQIQRMLLHMTRSGEVTSRIIADAYARVDKAVDLFYLAVSMNNPSANPDFEGLVDYDPGSKAARALARLTQDILKPADPANPTYKTARDVLGGIQRIETCLATGETCDGATETATAATPPPPAGLIPPSPGMGHAEPLTRARDV